MDYHGTIVVWTDGSQYSVSTESGCETVLSQVTGHQEQSQSQIPSHCVSACDRLTLNRRE